ncbi:MAG: DUF2306 domain-containing protein [Proteobacteria bacterium]|nr:DUF2306 domain-containing protein [Pseudomonadota bacterium]
MHLEAPPGAPLVVQLACDALLYSHIGGGMIGMSAGAVALLTRKGERVHRIAGSVFTAAMLVMAGVGAGVAPFLPAEQIPNTTAGVFTFYLVLTGWMTVRRAEGRIGLFERLAILIPVAGAGIGLYLSTRPEITGIQHMATYVIAGIATLSALGDVHLLLRKGLLGRPRIARHVWRMCVALTIAAFSFFVGQQGYLPKAVRGTFLLNLPGFAALLFMTFWLLRVWLSKAFRSQPLQPRIAA